MTDLQRAAEELRKLLNLRLTQYVTERLAEELARVPLVDDGNAGVSAALHLYFMTAPTGLVVENIEITVTSEKEVNYGNR